MKTEIGEPSEESNRPANWLLHVCIAASVVAVGAGLMFQRQVALDHVAALGRMAEISAMAKRPATRSTYFDAEGVAQHTLCTGSGWCITDRVPPEAPEKWASKSAGGGVAVVNIEAICAPIFEGGPQVRNAMRSHSEKLLESCDRFINTQTERKYEN